MYEILNANLPRIEKNSRILTELQVIPDEYLLVTLHRAENVDTQERLAQFVDLIMGLPGQKVFPAHPRTVKALKKSGLMKKLHGEDDVIITPPRSYLDMLTLARYARAVMTDSGGLQKEAYFLRRPCLTLRPETEWVETVDAGANTLIDLSLRKARAVLRRKRTSHRKPTVIFGGKTPSEIIAATIESYLRSG
jgi:UDP-N-acetylglucosamine 2-epimerase